MLLLLLNITSLFLTLVGLTLAGYTGEDSELGATGFYMSIFGMILFLLTNP